MYYIALLAPEAINVQVLEWKHFMRDLFGCVIALKSPAHVTLCSPFWMNSDLQQSLEESIKTFSSAQKGFDVELKNFDSFKPRVIFVHVNESSMLSQLQQGLEAHLLSNPLFPVKKTTKPFHPHITIANRDLGKNDFRRAWDHFWDKKYEASFQANGITLLRHNGLQWEPVYTAFFPLV